MQHFELKGQTRKVGNKAVLKAFRKEGLVPCNLYGLGMENVLFTVNAKELKTLTDTPKSYIVTSSSTVASPRPPFSMRSSGIPSRTTASTSISSPWVPRSPSPSACPS